jgi:ribonuclease-3
VNGDPRRLSRALKHRFRNPQHLERALTHRSAGADNNERLEFLGDALLGFIIAEVLSERFPDADEGSLSRLRASLVNKESLARLARSLELGEYLRLDGGVLRTGGHDRDSTLSDALEAVFAAVYLDRGFDVAKEVILRLYQDRLKHMEVRGPVKDPKTRLQELLQSDKRPLPVYEVMDIGGSQHDQSFLVRCVLTDSKKTTRGRGTSRRRAEQQAAEKMLELIEHDNRNRQ